MVNDSRVTFRFLDQRSKVWITTTSKLVFAGVIKKAFKNRSPANILRGLIYPLHDILNRLPIPAFTGAHETIYPGHPMSALLPADAEDTLR